MTHRAKPVLAREVPSAHALPEARPDQALHQEAELDAWQEVPIGLCTAHYQLQHAYIQSVVQITRISSRAASLGSAGNASCTMQQWVIPAVQCMGIGTLGALPGQYLRSGAIPACQPKIAPVSS